MKILIAFYEINNLGGIINHVEHLIAGFKELGHEVEFAELHWKDRVVKSRADYSEHEVNASGMPVHQSKGWKVPEEWRLPYKGEENIQEWKERASEFDLVIWEIPVPTKQKANKGNTDWRKLYDLPDSTKQVAITHDGNLRMYYPWILFISQKIDGLAAVHPCSYHSASVVPTPRAMILNPQPPIPDNIPSWGERDKGFLSCQTFKGWKHVDDLVRAIPHLEDCEEIHLAGGGIEQAYMTSDNKCKKKYKYENGDRIWDVALENGMEWHGYITEDERDDILTNVRTLIDPSWSKRYSKYGDHFNRVVVDALRVGAIPLARPLGISTNHGGYGEIFKPWKNYVPIPMRADSKEYAQRIDEVNNLSAEKAGEIIKNGHELFDNFERTTVAQQYIDLANGKPTGWYGKLEVGSPTKKVSNKAKEVWRDFFMADEE